jgi:hypothetical protein
MKSYELHTLKDGKWKIDSVFDDQETALHEARRAQTANRYTTIRVIEEDYDQLSNHTATRTIFRADGGNSPDPKVTSQRQAPKAPGSGFDGSPAGGWKPKHASAPAAQKKKAGLVLPLIALLVIGVAVLVGLNFLPSGF